MEFLILFFCTVLFIVMFLLVKREDRNRTYYYRNGAYHLCFCTTALNIKTGYKETYYFLTHKRTGKQVIVNEELFKTEFIPYGKYIRTK